MGEIPKVALLIETARGFGRNFLLGVARYSRLHGPWSIHITPGDYNHVVPEMKQWGGLGIIARIPNRQVANAIIKANVPTIALGLTDEQLRPGKQILASNVELRYHGTRTSTGQGRGNTCNRHKLCILTSGWRSFGGLVTLSRGTPP
jgi:hypothetical protein